MNYIDRELAVKGFAHKMVDKLCEPRNLDKGSWRSVGMQELLRLLKQEVAELEYAIEEACDKDIATEAVDIANFCMMIADNASSPKHNG